MLIFLGLVVSSFSGPERMTVSASDSFASVPWSPFLRGLSVSGGEERAGGDVLR